MYIHIYKILIYTLYITKNHLDTKIISSYSQI